MVGSVSLRQYYTPQVLNVYKQKTPLVGPFLRYRFNSRRAIFFIKHFFDALTLTTTHRYNFFIIYNYAYSANFLNRNAFPITVTELRLMAAAAIMGLSNSPKNGYRIPAARGTPKEL